MDTCLFCKIISKELTSYTIYSDAYVTAFLDRYPVANGHILMVPNTHYEHLHEIDDIETAGALLHRTAQLAKLLVANGICTDYSIVQSNGRYAEQDIPHVHIHIIPRYENDDVAFHLPTHPQAATEEKLEEMLTLLKKE